MSGSQRESDVRFYSRCFPATFDRARGAHLFDVDGRTFIDFLSGSGAMNYGHNHPRMIQAVMDYMANDGLLNSLDMDTRAKRNFLDRFFEVILAPRDLDYRVQFTGPTGTNAIEAALKLARKVTGRRTVVAFTNAFHGVTVGSLAVSASSSKRAAAGVDLSNSIRMPFDGFLGGGELEQLEAMFTRPGSGLDAPAAFILETVQGEGGLNVASPEWLQGVERLARQVGALVIVDDIQAGCGRVNGFFSFERAGIRPDLVCLSKSLSGLGLPLSVVLIAPEHDHWAPGEHNGTFRGNNLAFVSAAAALDLWEDPEFTQRVQDNMAHLKEALDAIPGARPRGLGLLVGLKVESTARAASIQRHCFEQGLLLETCGPEDKVVKLMPPLNIDPEILAEGLQVLQRALDAR